MIKYAPYSFSKITTFETCPKQFEYVYILKEPKDEDFSDPLFFIRGRFVHAYIANRLSGGSGMLSGYSSLDPVIKIELVEHAENMIEDQIVNYTFEFDKTFVEKKIYLNTELELAEKSDYAWTGAIDYFAVHGDIAVIFDWKTGKHKDSPDFTQMMLYAIWVLDSFSDIREIDLVFYYIEYGTFAVKTICRDNVIDFKKELISRVHIIENVDCFKKIVSQNCQWCAYKSVCNPEGVINE